MKILVFGAGVLGCNLARDLFRAGKDVTLLARGSRADNIAKHGLRIKDKFSFRVSTNRVPVVTRLNPDDKYDVIFVVLRYNQLDGVIDILRANRARNIVFVGNNVSAAETAARLPEINVLFAFALSAAFACYKTDGDLKKLKGDTAYLDRLIDANIEGYRAVKSAGHEILPKADKDFEGAQYRKTCLRFFKLMCATSLGKLCASDHAMNAVDEMSALNRDLEKFFDEQKAEYPVWKALEKEAGRYLK